MTNDRSVRVLVAALVACVTLGSVISPAAIPVVHGGNVRLPDRVSQPRDSSISFEENRGQWDPQVLFAGKGNGQTVFLTADEATFVLPMPSAEAKPGSKAALAPTDRETPRERAVYALKMKFSGANLQAGLSFEDELEGTLNYFKGNDPSRWATDVPRYRRVTSTNIYPGIDLAWYGNDAGAMEYDLVVSPGADPGQIGLEFDGADRLFVDEAGNLAVETPAGTMRHNKPVVYQDIDGQRRAVEGAYTIGGNRVGFSLGDYDRSKTLVIDPILPPIYYSTYLGGTSTDEIRAIKVDAANYAYVAGLIYSTDFPVTAGPAAAYGDGFVTKITPNGNALAYSVVLGGNQIDSVNALAIDSGGNAYVTGETSSTNFPTTWLSYDASFNGGTDAFVTKLGPTGSTMEYSEYLGGSQGDTGADIAVDPQGSVYVTGVTHSPNYPTTAGAYDQTYGGPGPGIGFDGFVTKFTPNGLFLSYSTYLGSTGDIYGTSIAVDSQGRAFVAGRAGSGYFPVTPGSYTAPAHATVKPDYFVAKFNSTGSAFVYACVIGGDGDDRVEALAIDASGNAYLTGYTDGSNYPVTFGAYDITHGPGLYTALVTKLNSAGSGLNYSTYLGGNDNSTFGYAIAVNSAGAIYVTGRTSSASFPTTSNAYDITLNGSYDVFLTKLQPSPFASLAASTYLGGTGADQGNAIALNAAGDAFVAGNTSSTNYPLSYAFVPYDSTFGGVTDGFITRYDKAYLP